MATIASLARFRLVVPLTKRAISSSSRLYEETYEKKIREEKVRFYEERGRADEETIHLLQSQSEYRPMRMRFLSTFKCDHLPGEHGVTHADRECIEDGNWQANGADPVGDVDLYQQAQRTDQSAFEAYMDSAPYMSLA